MTNAEYWLDYWEPMLAAATSPTWRRHCQSQVNYYRIVREGERDDRNGDIADGGVDVVDRGSGGDTGRAGGGLADHKVSFRGKNEAAWARLMDVLGVMWKYEALEPEMARALRYLPDFWLGERLAWLEIKSERPTPGEIKVARQVLEADGHPVYVVSGWPWPKSFGVWVFAEAGEAEVVRNDWGEIALAQLFDCGWAELRAAFKVVKKRR